MKAVKKKWLLLLALTVILCAGTIGGAYAWMNMKTEPVINTFSSAGITLTLTEGDDLDLVMIPGKVITKDPKATVGAGSVSCWLFVKVEESENFDDFMTYTMADGWTALNGETKVYYRKVEASEGESGKLAADAEYGIIKDDKVNVKADVTKAALTGMTESDRPTLNFKAYAVQLAGFSAAADAWSEVGNTPGSGN